MLTKPEENLIKIYENSFRKNWELEAVTDYGTSVTLTYGQMAERIAYLHLLFERVGIQVGDRIAVMGKNNSNWVTTYLATMTYGAVIVPILQDFKANDAIHIINHSESKLLFITDLIWENIDVDQVPDLQAVISLNTMDLIVTGLPKQQAVDKMTIEEMFAEKYPNGFTKDDVHYIERSNAELASINYTSGTTGFSKGVMTPMNALAGNIVFGLTTKLVYQGCRHVAFLPLAHAYGCAFDFLACLAAGGHSYLIGRTPSPKILMKAFAEVKPTVILSVPLILEKIYKKMIQPQISKKPISWVLKMPLLDKVVLNKIRETLMNAFGGEFSQIIIGGAPLNAEVEAFLRRIKFPVTVGYGMTETAPLISFTPWDRFRSQSCGQVLKGFMEARIANPDADGVGEIQVRGENVMVGYYKNEQATKDSFTADGWLRTGDLGVIDEDGYIYIKGRCKTMLLGPSGQNIYPEEIEAKINNMPYVLESLVLQKDTRLVALVCPDFEAVDADKLSQEQLEVVMEENRKLVNAELAAYEQINELRIYTHEFEKTPKKSIKRFLYEA
ncbi:MAG: long-chain fatty acid--CoA ligase [Bacteroidales bacterium]|nr:long-chain fatty acid--CoA ligase [Bacteroidales bacterium]